MVDGIGRDINYLRVSLTKKCNLNCTYCGAECESSDELTVEEIVKIVRVFASLGISKVRLTGGEPLMRWDICEIARSIKAIGGIKKLAITTNGVFLSRYAQKLKAAGIDAVNISLDTTDREQYRRMTGYDMLPRVLEGIGAAQKVGLSPLRLNAVLIRGENDTQAASLIDIARNNKIDVRFIELMPFSDEGEDKSLVVTGDEIIKQFPFLHKIEKGGCFESSVARYYTAEGFLGRVGFITPVSDKFCESCNRIRLLSDGKLKPCLGSDKVYDLRACLEDEALLTEKIREAILSKPVGHSFECGYGINHGLNRIGG